jgi:UrcA family protein
MNIPEKTLERPQYDFGYSKLVLAGLCIVFMTAAIAKQLPARAADAVALVSLADIDLSTNKGMQTARDRIDETARRLCKKVIDPWTLSHHSQYLRCVDDATTAALGQIANQVLVAKAQP